MTINHLFKATSSWRTDLPRLLCAGGDGGELLDILLGDAAHLPGPLGALGAGGVAGRLRRTLLLHLSSALNYVIHHVMLLVLGPALGLVLGCAELRTLNVAILLQRSSAHLDSLIVRHGLVLDEATLPEVLLALLLLLGLVVGDVGGVAPLVVAVVTLDLLVVLGHGGHLHLVNTPLSIVSWSCRRNIIKAGRGFLHTLASIIVPPVLISVPLPRIPGTEVLEQLSLSKLTLSLRPLLVPLVLVLAVAAPGVEGEGVDK